MTIYFLAIQDPWIPFNDIIEFESEEDLFEAIWVISENYPETQMSLSYEEE